VLPLYGDELRLYVNVNRRRGGIPRHQF